MWATKILAEFQHYLKTAEDCVDSKSKILVDHYIGMNYYYYNTIIIITGAILYCILEMAGDHGTSKDLYDEIMAKKESIKATAPKRKKKTTKLWREFEESYLMDLNVSNDFPEYKKALK